VEDIPAAFRAEIEQFFRIYKELEHLPTRTSGFGDRGEALRLLAEGRARTAAATVTA
jgi:inorganic pyrophosphatase